MHRRAHNPCAAKTHRCYSVEELMKLYDCHRNTIYNWAKAGLRPIDDKYPSLFHGTVVNAFHRAQRAKSKRPCGPGQVYCVVCRAPQAPGGSVVDYQPMTQSTGRISAICPSCDRIILRVVNKGQLAEFEATCSVKFLTDKHT